MNDRDVVAVVEASWLMRAVAGALCRVAQIADDSIAVSRARALHQWWHHERSSQRRRAVGTMLVAAGSVHLLLRAPDAPPGWLWMIVPGWATIVGAFLLAVSSRALDEEKS